MAAELINGRAIAARIRQKVRERISALPSKPGMAAILIGDDAPSHLYVNLKERACKSVGIHFEKHILDAKTPTEDVADLVRILNERENIHGILVQLPLPNQSENTIIAEIHPDKDIDGFHKESFRRLESGEPGLVSPVALGIMKLIDETEQDVKGMTAVIIASEVFATPIKSLLEDRGVTTSIISKSEAKTSELISQADIVVVAVGEPNTITADIIKDGAIVIDVGTNDTPEGLKGDASQDVNTKASFLTPVPGGVGPTTVAMLTLNVLKAFLIQSRS